jgi:hydrogenase expression/formation protein HypE
MPTDANNADRILLAHGGGGELTRRLLAERILPRLANDLLAPLGDAAVLDGPAGRLAFTTDAYVVQPLVFPGGDIGRLAVCGTVNDLAVMGAEPKALSLALVIEEGLAVDMLEAVVDSIAAAAREADVVVATGDTKVVERGRGDGLTITTAGVGVVPDGVRLGLERIAPGDAVLVTGRIAEHGLAVMSVREGLGFETELASDVAPLAGLTAALRAAGDVKFLRDPTRGGLAGVLADISEGAGVGVEVHEDAVPISPTARHAAELLGLDPLAVANEGKCVAVVAGNDAEAVLAACRAHPLGAHAAVVGRVAAADVPLVELITRVGGRRVVQRPYGEELPRIC